jgi:hypothetical protein
VIARVWFDKSDEARPWRIAYADGAQARAEHVEFEYAETRFSSGGFTELPCGPRGILEGELSRVTGEVPA